MWKPFTAEELLYHGDVFFNVLTFDLFEIASYQPGLRGHLVSLTTVSVETALDSGKEQSLHRQFAMVLNVEILQKQEYAMDHAVEGIVK